MPLTSVTGGEVECRVLATNNHYLKQRVVSATNGSKVTHASSGRLRLSLNWLKLAAGEHKYGMSFGKLLAEGSNWSEKGADNCDCWRATPKYPKLRQTKRRNSRSAELVVHNSGQAFVFEEEGSNNSDAAARRQRGSAQSSQAERDFKLYFPSNSSEDNTNRSYNSPTESPGRSETDRDSSEASNDQAQPRGKSSSVEPLPTGGSGTVPHHPVGAQKAHLKAQHKAYLVDSFLHNGHDYGGLSKSGS